MVKASLDGTNVLVVQVAVLSRTPVGEIVADEVWTAEPSRGELGFEYAAKTHLGAKRFIAGRDTTTQDVLFALLFPPNKKAA